jgi:superfamily II DNA/RNA helicase
MVARLLNHPNLIVMSASIEPLAGFDLIHLEGKTKLVFHEDEEYEYKPGDVVLEFCNSVADCLERAENVPVPKRYRAAYDQAVIKNVYHGALTPTERLLVQDMYVRGEFPYLYATDAAAQGINLPANVVIIPEVNYKGEPHPDKTLRQMAGRCGRFGQQATGHVYLKKKPQDQREAITNLPKFEEQTLGDVLRGRVPPCFVGADMQAEVRGAEIQNAIALSSHPVRFYTYSDFSRYQYEFSFLNRIKDQLRPRFREYIVENRQLFLDTFSPLPMIELLVKD